jgi:acyl-CoA synthetase (AMP-forming)/AMP-acid ligase II
VTATVVDAGDGLPLTVPALLRERAAARPDAVLLVCDDDVLTYGAADRRSARLARGLLASGAGNGTHVGTSIPTAATWSWLGWRPPASAR